MLKIKLLILFSAIKMTQSITILIQMLSRLYEFSDKYPRHSNGFCVRPISIKPVSRGWECNCVIPNCKCNYVSHSISQPLHFDFQSKLLYSKVCSCNSLLSFRIIHIYFNLCNFKFEGNIEIVTKLHTILMQAPNLFLTSYFLYKSDHTIELFM